MKCINFNKYLTEVCSSDYKSCEVSIGFRNGLAQNGTWVFYKVHIHDIFYHIFEKWMSKYADQDQIYKIRSKLYVIFQLRWGFLSSYWCLQFEWAFEIWSSSLRTFKLFVMYPIIPVYLFRSFDLIITE